MAERKTARKSTPKPVEAVPLSNQEIVLEKYPDAECMQMKDSFVVFFDKQQNSISHAGIAKSESDAWKLAAHAVL